MTRGLQNDLQNLRFAMVSYSRSFKDHHDILCGTRSVERTSLLRFREKLEKAKLKLRAWHLVATVRSNVYGKAAFLVFATVGVRVGFLGCK